MSVERNTTQILLVEDSAGDALLTGQILAEAPVPIKLVIARDGEQALTMLADLAFKPALIILDLNIPLISGHIVLQRNTRKDIPVVVFSVSDDERDVERALEFGAREYVQKPMGLQAYKEAIWRMIKKWALTDESAADGAAAT